MIIETKELGFVEIDEKEIINFPNGIYGFEDAKRFVLLSHKKSENPFLWLQCVDSKEPCFIVTDPVTLFEDYSPNISDEVRATISLKSNDDLRILCTATVPGDVKKMYVNLRCPIVINGKDNISVQTILDNDSYPMRYYLFDKRGA